MDYWFCVSVCLHVSVFSRERYNVQMLRASLSETPGKVHARYTCNKVHAQYMCNIVYARYMCNKVPARYMCNKVHARYMCKKN